MLHTGYYFFTRLNGKLIKRYIRRADLPQFTALVNRARERREQRRRIIKENLGMLRDFRLDLRETQALINSLQT
jgi:hypothetical protein